VLIGSSASADTLRLKKSGWILSVMAAAEEVVTNALALGNLSSRSFRPKKWSPWAWVMWRGVEILLIDRVLRIAPHRDGVEKV